jgi:signal transduction histidine kinase
MTADSLPPRTRGLFGVEPKAAADARFITDLMDRARTGAFGRAPGDSDAIDLDLVERAFGAETRSGVARHAVDAARVRMAKRAVATGEVSEAAAFAFAADLFVALAVERPWRPSAVRDLVPALGVVFHMSADGVASELLRHAVRAPQLLELPTGLALEIQLAALVALSFAAEASLWSRGVDGKPTCVAAVGQTAATRRIRTVALAALEGSTADTGERGTIVGVPVSRWEAPWGALVIRLRTRYGSTLLLDEAAQAMTPIVERHLLLQRSAAREQSLVRACEKRMGRLAFDLHDGALQNVAALSADVQLLRRQLAGTAGAEKRLVARVDDFDARVGELDRVLRELAHSLEPVSLVRRPLPELIEAEAAGLRNRMDVEVSTVLTGELEELTPSQKIAVIRVIQEALTNVREHTSAANVSIRVTGRRGFIEAEVVDDGEGFAVNRTLLAAARRGRLGLVGGSERIRLLGGTFDVESRPGGPTTVSFRLPRWRPLATEQAPGEQVAR